jgi:YD repeat-containing protein
LRRRTSTAPTGRRPTAPAGRTPRTTAAGPVSRAALTRTSNRAGQVLTEASTISGDPTNGTTTYTYDPLERLTSAARPGMSTLTYGWAAVPDRTSVQVGAGTPLTTSFDDAHRPTLDSAGGTYTSDGDGRLTSQPGQRLAWDALGRLTAVYPATGITPLATYAYDPLDRLRIVDHGGTDRVRFRYVGLTTSVAQTIDDQSGAVLRNIGTGWGGERLLDWSVRNFG